MKKRKRSRYENYRARQLGDVRHIIRCRGPIPNNSLGRDCLDVLLCLESLRKYEGDVARRSYLLTILKNNAPWMRERDRIAFVQSILSRPIKQRELSSVQIGRLMDLRNSERLECKTTLAVMPYDVTAEELAVIKQQQARERAWRRSRRAGSWPRERYLAEVASEKPWIKLGLTERTYYRWKAKGFCDAKKPTAKVAEGISRPLRTERDEPTATSKAAKEASRQERLKATAERLARRQPASPIDLSTLKTDGRVH